MLLTAAVAADPPDAYVDSICQANNVAGLSACAFYGDSLLWSGTYGCKNFSYADSMVNEETLFYLWSVTKPFNAIAFMQLWEDGLVDLDADVNDYLPCSVRNPNFPDTPITPRMVLCHTSSLRAAELLLPGELEAGDTTYTNTEYVQEVYVPGGLWYDPVANFHTWEPGTGFAYNQHRAQAVIAAIVEQVSPYSAIYDLHCREYIFDPLGMEDPSYLIESVDTMNVALPYQYSHGVYSTPYGYPSAANYAGWMLKASPMDLSRALIAFMLGGEAYGVRILDDATVDTIMKVQYPDLNADWGLGWRKEENFWGSGRTVWGHWGNSMATFGFNGMFFCPEENSAVIVVQNYGSPSNCKNIMNVLFDYVADQTWIEGDPVMPAWVTLHQPCPNPFPVSTTVSFELPQAADVRLDVYDFSGRLVETLVDQSMTAGEHSVVFDGSGMPSGVYLLRLQSGSGVATARVVLVR